MTSPTTFAPIVRLCRSFDRMGDKNSPGRKGKHCMVSTSIYIQKILTIFNNPKLPETNHLSTSNNQSALTEDNRCQLRQSFTKKYKIFIFNILHKHSHPLQISTTDSTSSCEQLIYKLRPRAWT